MKFEAKWFESHPIVKACESVSDIVSPFLQSNNLSHFSYVKRYVDGLNYSLTTHTGMLIDFHKYAFYEAGNFSSELAQEKNGSLLWLAAGDHSQPLFSYAREAWQLANGVVVVEESEHYTEQWYFATSPECRAANNFYLNNLELLKRFNAYFVEQSAELRAVCEQNLLPDSFENTQKPSLTHVPLSPREEQLLALLASGFSCKRIAEAMGVKVKTVYFYLDNLKQKTALFNRDSLVDYYQNRVNDPIHATSNIGA